MTMSKKSLLSTIENPKRHIALCDARGNVLGSVLWTLIHKLNINTGVFTKRMNEYINKDGVLHENIARKRSEKFSNLSNEITNITSMSFPKMIEGLRAAGFLSIEITFKVKAPKGKELEHTYKQDFD